MYQTEKDFFHFCSGKLIKLLRINRLAFLFSFVLWLLSSQHINADGISSIAKTNRLLKTAEEAYKKKDFKTVIEAYEAALKEQSDLPEQVAYNLGNAYLETKQYNKASKNFQNAAATAKSGTLKSSAYQQLGNISATQSDFKSALDWYKKSLKNNPKNESARLNYELAYQLNKKKEEQQKQNQPKPENKEENKEQKKEEKQKDQKQQTDQKEGKQGEKDQKQAQNEDKQGQKKQGKQEKGKDGKEGEDPNAQTSEADQKGENGNQEEEDKEGKEKSKSKGGESNMDDPNAVKVDKQKLLESGLSEEQARSLLQAMRNSEVKYLQQRRFGSKKDRNRESSGKPRW